MWRFQLRTTPPHDRPVALKAFATRLVGRSAVLLTVTALSLTGAAAATAAPGNARPSDQERDVQAEAGHAAVVAAVERDFGLTADEAEELMAVSGAATELDERLRAELGDAVVASWLDLASGQLVVQVSEPAAARTARAEGATVQLAGKDRAQLDAIVESLDAEVRADPDAFAGVYEWYVDPVDNEVVVTVGPGRASAAAELAAAHGDTVRVEVSDAGRPELNHHGAAGSWLDGGTRYNSCSIGFNVRNHNNGNRYFLTAGHCGTSGTSVSSHGTSVGQFVHSSFPGNDFALVRVTNTSAWSQGGYVWTYGQGTLGSFITITQTVDPPVGTVVCSSGYTTQVTCGRVSAKNVTVNYSAGQVTGLIQHTACTKPGDSGGSLFTTEGNNTYRGVGLQSGGAAPSCSPGVGSSGISYDQPLGFPVALYGFGYGISFSWW